jgi:hypothetical protein
LRGSIARGGVVVDARERTCVRGLYVAGDASRDVQFVIVAAAEGATAAMALNRGVSRGGGVAGVSLPRFESFAENGRDIARAMEDADDFQRASRRSIEDQVSLETADGTISQALQKWIAQEKFASDIRRFCKLIQRRFGGIEKTECGINVVASDVAGLICKIAPRQGAHFHSPDHEARRRGSRSRTSRRSARHFALVISSGAPDSTPARNALLSSSRALSVCASRMR